MVSENLSFSFALDKPPGYKLFEESKIKIFKQIKNLLCLISPYI